MGKKFFWLILVLAAVTALFFIGSNILADPIPATQPFSEEPDVSEQAWYDEVWQASGFYNLEDAGAGGNFKYKYRANEQALINNTTATTNPDVVVTEWDVTGHVHFSSSGL